MGKFWKNLIKWGGGSGGSVWFYTLLREMFSEIVYDILSSLFKKWGWNLILAKIFTSIFLIICVVIVIYLFYVIFLLIFSKRRQEISEKLKTIKIGNVLIVIFIFILCSIILVFIANNYKAEESQKKSIVLEKVDSIESKEELTLEYLFDNDFNNDVITDREHPVIFKDKSAIIMRSKVFMDFQANTKFVGYYIPVTPNTYEACVEVAQSPVAFQGIQNFEIELEGRGLRPINWIDLTFSGRVFIYHETILFSKDKKRLIEIFEANGQSVEFRGIEYLQRRKEKLIYKVREMKGNNVER